MLSVCEWNTRISYEMELLGISLSVDDDAEGYSSSKRVDSPLLRLNCA